MLDLMPSKEELNKLFIYQASDGTLLWRERHNRNAAGSRAGRSKPHPTGYYKVRLKLGDKIKEVFVHRIVYTMHYGKAPALDHINNIKTDNRIENLRPATQTQNMCNVRTTVKNTSGVKGVSWNKSHKKWVALVGLNGKRISAGEFTTVEEAAVAVRELREKLHGGYTRHA